MNDMRTRFPIALLAPVLLGFLIGFASVAALDLNGQARAVRQALFQPAGHSVLPAQVAPGFRAAMAQAFRNCTLA